MSTITIRNVTVKDNGRLLNNATLSGSRDVLVDSASIEGNAVALENLIVGDFLQEVENHVFEMSPDEYASFQELLQNGKGSKATFLTSLRRSTCQTLPWVWRRTYCQPTFQKGYKLLSTLGKLIPFLVRFPPYCMKCKKRDSC